ncbi:MAG: putative sugar O-methyltransferase [Methanolobus sp.]|jgi:putative sugar O-methyltransferase|nr:putative sugar O-methyltransferase [Methanolobus sp.]
MNNDVKFLRNETIKKTMFLSVGGRWQNTQIKYLKTIIDEKRLRELLHEDCVGHPTITSFKYNSSHNLIHHLYHLVKFQSETDINLNAIDTVVEFGGGYGSMCRLMKRFNRNSTYIIIDLPIFSFIQLYYLKEIYGEGEVNIILSDKDEIIPNKINLIPIDERLVDKIKTVKPDLFIATWSLSEANKYGQDYIYANDFFDSKSILIAHQKISKQFEHAESIKFSDKYRVVYNEETKYIPDNYYLFAKKID